MFIPFWPRPKSCRITPNLTPRFLQPPLLIRGRWELKRKNVFMSNLYRGRTWQWRTCIDALGKSAHCFLTLPDVWRREENPGGRAETMAPSSWEGVGCHLCQRVLWVKACSLCSSQPFLPWRHVCGDYLREREPRWSDITDLRVSPKQSRNVQKLEPWIERNPNAVVYVNGQSRCSSVFSNSACFFCFFVVFL